MKKRKIAVFLLFILFINFFFSTNFEVFAAVNENYGEPSKGVDTSEIGSNSVLLEWIGEIVFTFASSVESIGAWLIGLTTGYSQFPWIDKVIFNTVPILDINFINPASGSFFENSDGTISAIGEVVRNTYFSILAIAIGFLSIIIAVMAIRLAISTIASEKAKYKEAIAQWVTCLVLLFGLHYLLSFLFYLNETLVSLAGSMMTDILTEDVQEIINNIEAKEKEDNPKMVENFLNACDDQCFIDDIPIIGPIWNALTGFLQGVGKVLGKIWDFFTGADESEADVIAKDQLGKLYPSRQDMIDGINDSDENVNVAAYLLKNEYYRRTYLQYTHGTDGNDFSSDGLSGVARNILVTANDIFGIADTGYKSIRTLYTSVLLITFKPNGSGSKPYTTVQEDSYNHLSDEEKNNLNNSTDDNGNKLSTSSTRSKNSVSTEGYYSERIHSTQDYIDYISLARQNLDAAERRKDDGEIIAANLDIIYANAYYNCVYDGDDKVEPTAEAFISELGQYFKSLAYYVDIDGGGWAPDNINVLAAVLYGVLVIQSLLIFVAYLKRFFYVIILSIMGPAVVVFDFMKKLI